MNNDLGFECRVKTNELGFRIKITKQIIPFYGHATAFYIKSTLLNKSLNKL
jgi:hypothetical protein